MRKVSFVCPACGGNNLLHVEAGALLKSPVKELEVLGGVVFAEYEGDGTLIITDESETEMRTLGYECERCGSVLVKGNGDPCNSHEDLFRWLRGEKMLGEEHDEEDIAGSINGHRS